MTTYMGDEQPDKQADTSRERTGGGCLRQNRPFFLGHHDVGRGIRSAYAERRLNEVQFNREEGSDDSLYG